MPAYQEIMSLVGFKSKNAVYKLINKLVADQVLDKDSRGRLIPNQLIGEVPLLGLVEAGFPTMAEEHVLDTMNIDQYLIGDKNKDKTYMLEVKGDSMIEAGINEGDLVIAERIGGTGASREAKEGDIVIVPGRVLGKGDVSKKLVVCALGFSEEAEKKLKAKKCEIKSIFNLITVEYNS